MMGVESQEKGKRGALTYSTCCRTLAIWAALLFLLSQVGCVKTSPQEVTPPAEPKARPASQVEQDSFAESVRTLVTVHYPADLAVMEFNLLNISVSLPRGSADLIEVEVNSQVKATIVPRREFECFSVPLELGINEINLRAKEENRIVDEVALKVFRRSDLVGNYEKPPAGFTKDYFHAKDRSPCGGCHHVLEPTAADENIINLETYTAEVLQDKAIVPSDSSCYSCHRRITSYSFVHGPKFVWRCLTCHDSRAEPKYALKYPVPELCYKCHVEEKQKRTGKKSYHAPYITNKCGICHNPHGAENPCGLDKPIWLLCVSCHPDQGDGRHVIAPYFWGTRHHTHPTHGVPDPSNKGHELTCASCHDPHASDSPMFITKYGTRSFELCMKCHWKNKP
jgi:predicted CXXCH cytochrome family protein